jgi:proteasome lid subunit RPN8/RPN11
LKPTGIAPPSELLPAGSESPLAIAIPADLLAQVYAHARAAFPAECCGYLVGPRDGAAVDGWVACTNAQAREQLIAGRGEDRAFAIAGAELYTFARTFDTPRPARIVYHSHTNGRAYFSAADRAMAATRDGPTYPVQHLVIGVAPLGPTEAVVVGWSHDEHDFVELERWSM